MEVSIAENRRQHAALGNVGFLVADVTELEQVCEVLLSACVRSTLARSSLRLSTALQL
jgi:hypothetical protein